MRRVASMSRPMDKKPMIKSMVVGSPARAVRASKKITRYREEYTAAPARRKSYQGIFSLEAFWEMG